MSNGWVTAALVAAGGFAGTVCRYWLSGRIAARYRSLLPAGILTVNAVGCLLLGFIYGLGADQEPGMLPLLGSGFLGGFTTFSTFKLDTDALFTGGHRRTAWFYLALSYMLGLTLAWAGFAAGSRLHG